MKFRVKVGHARTGQWAIYEFDTRDAAFAFAASCFDDPTVTAVMIAPAP